PGGVANADRLRTDRPAVRFLRESSTRGTPIAVICHGPWAPIDAGVVDARTLTSWPSLRTDLTNAGAEWVDREVAVCEEGPGPLVSSRGPEDLDAFRATFLEVFARHRAPLGVL